MLQFGLDLWYYRQECILYVAHEDRAERITSELLDVAVMTAELIDSFS